MTEVVILCPLVVVILFAFLLATIVPFRVLSVVVDDTVVVVLVMTGFGDVIGGLLLDIMLLPPVTFSLFQMVEL